MYPDVELQVLPGGERLAAHVAQVVALARMRAQVAPQRVEVRELARAHVAAQHQRARQRVRVRLRAVRQQVPAGGGELVITRSEPTPPTCDRYNVTKLVVLHCVVWFAVAKREPLSNHRIPNISFK